MRWMLLVAAVGVLSGCISGTGAELQLSSLEALDYEMSDQDRAMLCDAFESTDDKGAVYRSFAAKWSSIIDTPPPSASVFENWMTDTVCGGT